MLAVAVGLALCGGAQAQIATDGTLGAATALSGPNFAIPASLGRQAGANLFHSFSTFNVPAGGSAMFSGPSSVANVLARVTGSTASSINGRLGTSIAGANLFLINPQGILFGSGATLDLTGSFHATTANYIRLSDGTRFEAVAVDPGVLSVAAPAAFGFLGPAPAPITVTSSVLNAATGKDASYVGGNVAISGLAARLRSRGGDLRIGSAAGAGEFGLDAALTPTQGMAQGTITASLGAQLIAESVVSPSLAPGRIVIRGGQIALVSATISSVNSRATDARPIEITSTGVSDGTINGAGFIARGALVISRSNGAGRGADVVINAPAMQFDQYTRVQTIAASSGRGGDLRFTAEGPLTVLAQEADPGFTTITSFALAGGRGGDIVLRGDRVTVDAGIVQIDGRSSGAGGGITLDGGEVSVINGGFVYSYMRDTSSGAGNDIVLNASRRVEVSGADWTDTPSSVLADAWGSGRGGSVRFSAPDIVFNGADYGTRAVGSGRGGDLTFTGERIALTDSLGYTYSYWTGNAGNIALSAPRITLAGRGIVSVSYDSGDAGTIRLSGDVIRLLPGFVERDVNIESSNSEGSGNGGNVEIRASTSFEISNAANRSGFTRVAAVTQGGGRGGSILIDAPSVVLDGGALYSRTRWGTGEQGQIQVRADTLRLLDSGRILSTTEGPRDGSLIDIVARSTVMQDASLIAATTDPDLTGFSPVTTGNAGRISITGESLRMTGASSIEVAANAGSAGNAGALAIDLTGSFEMVERTVARGFTFRDAAVWPGGLSSQARGSGDAGSISVRAGSILLDDGRIRSNALLGGLGGSVSLRAGSIELRNGAQVDARSAVGSSSAAGSIDVAATGSLLIGGRSPTDGAFSGLYAETQGSGAGGSITLAGDTVTIDRGIVRASTTGSGNAGPLTVRAGDLDVVNGGWIDAGTSAGSSGAGGRVDITAARSLRILGSDTTPVTTVAIAPDITRGVAGREQGPFASTISSNTAGSGDGGNVTIDAPRITIAGGGRVSANASGSGDAGSIAVTAADSLRLVGGSISTQALASDGGNIDIRVGEMLQLRGGEITTAVGGGSGAGGNIFIDPIFVMFDGGSRIVANAFGGPGGRIDIVANYFFNAPDTVIDASSALGVPGVVQISTPNVDVAGRLATLPAQLLDRSGLLRSACAVRGGAPASSLVAVGRGGLPVSPEQSSVANYFEPPAPVRTASLPGSTVYLASAIAPTAAPHVHCR